MNGRKWRALKSKSLQCCFFPATLLFILVMCVTALNAQTSSDKDIRKQLEEKLKNTTLIIRHFYSGNNLKYDSEGALSKGGNPGTWTLNAYFEPEKINLTKKSIILSGKRIFWSYDDSQNAPRLFRDSGNTKIEISRSSEQKDMSGIMTSLLTVFHKNGESLEDYVPPYWKNIIKANFDVKLTQRPKPPGSMLTSMPPAPTNVARVDFTPPVVRNMPKPDYTEEARAVRLNGIIVFSVVIDEDGNVKVTDIIKPLGMGLDDKSVRNIEENWEFSPAMRNGVPVSMDSVIEFQFKLL